MIAAMIAAVTAVIDGPDGWLGRAIGPQLLELQQERWEGRQIRLPYPPLIDVESITYLDSSDVEQTVADADWGYTGEFLWFGSAWREPALSCLPSPIRIRYRAGYDGQSVADGGTGEVPPQVKQAVILSVQHLRSLGAENLFLRVEETEGIARREFTVSAQAGQIVRDACDRLLMGLRRYA